MATNVVSPTTAAATDASVARDAPRASGVLARSQAPAAVGRVAVAALLVAGVLGAGVYVLSAPRRTDAPAPVSAPQTRTQPSRLGVHRLQRTEAEIARTIAVAQEDARTVRMPWVRAAGSAAAAARGNAGAGAAQDAFEDVNPDDPIWRVPLARMALTVLGTDEAAEDAWARAINDSTVDAEDRKDLIEDLNKDGFDDPERPSNNDVPLIDARLALIDRYAPRAIDATNAAAFAEAKKDLLEMRARAIADAQQPKREGAPSAAPKQ